VTPAGGGPPSEPGALGTKFPQNGGRGLSLILRLAFLAGPMLSMIDSSVVNVAVPTIVRSLHTPLGISPTYGPGGRPSQVTAATPVPASTCRA